MSSESNLLVLPLSVKLICNKLPFHRSDAESISTSVSQDSNKENNQNPTPPEATSVGAEEVVLRRKQDAKVGYE